MYLKFKIKRNTPTFDLVMVQGIGVEEGDLINSLCFFEDVSNCINFLSYYRQNNSKKYDYIFTCAYIAETDRHIWPDIKNSEKLILGRPLQEGSFAFQNFLYLHKDIPVFAFKDFLRIYFDIEAHE